MFPPIINLQTVLYQTNNSLLLAKYVTVYDCSRVSCHKSISAPLQTFSGKQSPEDKLLRLFNAINIVIVGCSICHFMKNVMSYETKCKAKPVDSPPGYPPSRLLTIVN